MLWAFKSSSENRRIPMFWSHHELAIGKTVPILTNATAFQLVFQASQLQRGEQFSGT